MNKRIVQSFMRFLILIVIALSSGCKQSVFIDAEEPISEQTEPEGLLILSTYGEIYSYNFQENKIKTISVANLQYDISYAKDSIYILRATENQVVGTGGFGPSELFKMNIDGTNVKQLTSDGYNEFSLSASPNGKYLAYFADWEGKNNRYKMEVYNTSDNTSQIISENHEKMYRSPIWSTDSKHLIYFEYEFPEKMNGHLFIYDTENEDTTELLNGQDINATSIGWAPDGKKYCHKPDQRE